MFFLTAESDMRDLVFAGSWKCWEQVWRTDVDDKLTDVAVEFYNLLGSIQVSDVAGFRSPNSSLSLG
jgi:hypothetical protein